MLEGGLGGAGSTCISGLPSQAPLRFPVPGYRPLGAAPNLRSGARNQTPRSAQISFGSYVPFGKETHFLSS